MRWNFWLAKPTRDERVLIYGFCAVVLLVTFPIAVRYDIKEVWVTEVAVLVLGVCARMQISLKRRR